MREQFPWFLDPTEEELQRLWEEATFSFDANVLLNLYRVDRETTQDYFKIFRELGDRIFLTNEAANQFFLNRRSVIRTEQSSFSKAKEEVEEWVERRKVFNDIKDQLRGGDIGQIIEDEIETVFEDREDYKDKVEAMKDDLIARIEDLEERFTPSGTTRANTEEDEILGELMKIFDGKTGSALDGDMEDLKEVAKERYERNQPPGYEDYDGDDEVSRGECEDFLIWKQLIEFAEREDEDVLFITGEEKADWWEVDREHGIVRPRHDLLREFRKETEQTFWMFSTEHLIENVNERLGVKVSAKSVDQIGKVSGDEDSVSETELNRALKLRNISEKVKTEERSILDIEDRIRRIGSHAALPKIDLKKGEIMSIMIEAINISNNMEGKETQKMIEEHFNKLSSAAINGERELALSHATDLRDYLDTVADTLRTEASDLADSFTSTVLY